jgi:hypothetical protein
VNRFLRLIVWISVVGSTALTTSLIGSWPAGAHQSATNQAPAAAESQDILAYAQLSDGSLGRLDLGTGTFTQFGSASVQLVGLGEVAGTLFTDTTGSGTLYTVNRTNGTLTAVGSANIGFQVFGSTANGLFALDNGMNLYSVDPASGAATLIGPTGLNPPDHNGLSSGSGTLYYTQQFGTSTPTVYTLNLSTGTATLVGSMPAVFGPVVIGGALYAESWVPCSANPSGICAQSIYSFDPATGTSALVSNVSTPMQEISDGLAPTLAPTITAVSPASGPLAGGTSVTITGSGFTGATAVNFGSTPASSFTANSDSQITASSPAAASVGPVDVTVTTPGGTTATGAADQYTYIYAFTGFQAPVAKPPVFNEVNRGQAIPLQWSLGGDFGLNILAPGYPTVQQVSCTSSAPVNTATETDTAGGSGLQFSNGTYTYVWKTSKTWADTCRQIDVRLNDGTDHLALFSFK